MLAITTTDNDMLMDAVDLVTGLSVAFFAGKLVKSCAHDMLSMYYQVHQPDSA